MNTDARQRASVFARLSVVLWPPVFLGVYWFGDTRLVDVLRVNDPEALKGRDWWQFLRAFGYLPTWLVVGAALTLLGLAVSRGAFVPEMARRLKHAGLAIVVSALTSGLLAELVKRLVGRVRPGADHVDRYKAFLSGFADDSNLSMPSSHAAVAFGAAWMILRLAPAPGVLVMVLAAGCGLTRLLVGAHYLSDVLVGALIGYAASLLTSRMLRGVGARV